MHFLIIALLAAKSLYCWLKNDYHEHDILLKKILSTLCLNKYLLFGWFQKNAKSCSKSVKKACRLRMNLIQNQTDPTLPLSTFFYVNWKNPIKLIFSEFKLHKFTKLLATFGGPSLSKFDVTILYLSKKKQICTFSVFFIPAIIHIYFTIYFGVLAIYTYFNASYKVKIQKKEKPATETTKC